VEWHALAYYVKVGWICKGARLWAFLFIALHPHAKKRSRIMKRGKGGKKDKGSQMPPHPHSNSDAEYV